MFSPLRRTLQGLPAPLRLTIRTLLVVWSLHQAYLIHCGCGHGRPSQHGITCQCDAGWEGRNCDMLEGHSTGAFTLRRIDNDRVEREIAFAKTGSQLPASTHGLFWMDHRGSHTAGIAELPAYRRAGPLAFDELVMGFGEAGWDAETRCISPVPRFGGSWTYMDQGGGGNSFFSVALRSRISLSFCFEDEGLSAARIHPRMRVPLLGWLPGWPAAFVEMTMVKTPFGWDRVSRPHWFLRAVLGERLGETPWHFPLFQIVDGDGRRTRHYDRYLAWANNDTDATVPGDLQQQMSRGNGTQLVGEWRGSWSDPVWKTGSSGGPAIEL